MFSGNSTLLWKGWRNAFPSLDPYMDQARKQTSGYDERDTKRMASMLADYALQKRISDVRARYWRIQHAMWRCL